MGTFFLLYLVFAIENIASFISTLMIFGWIALFCCGLGLFVLAVCYDPRTADISFTEYFKPMKKTYMRCVILSICLILVGTTGKLLPSQKDMIMIAAGTATYQAVTSDAGKELGSAAYSALLRKLDSIVKDEPKRVEAENVK